MAFETVMDVIHNLSRKYEGDKIIVRDADGNEYEVVSIEPDDDNIDRVVINIDEPV